MTPRTRRLWPLVAVLAGATFALDQASKAWALRTLVPGEARDLLGSFLRLDLIANSGAAFSLGSGQTWVFTLVAVVVGVLVVWAARRITSVPWAVAGGLVLGGLLGNLYDRLFRPPAFGQGHVVDFLSYNGWFIGNVADVAIVGAALLVALLSVLDIPYDGGRPREGRSHPAGPGTTSTEGATRA